jgi:hypothetical protein
MAKKILITEKQAQQFNKMLDACRQISKGYQTPDQLRKSSKNDYGLGYEETLEMSYENIQATALEAAKNVKPLQP